MRGSVTPGGATSGLDWMLCSKVWPGRMVRLSAGAIPVRPDRPAGRATVPRHRPLPASAGSRYLTPSGRMLFGMLGVFSEFERAMIRDRVLAGLDRARSSGKRLGRPGRRRSRCSAFVWHWMRVVVCERRRGY